MSKPNSFESNNTNKHVVNSIFVESNNKKVRVKFNFPLLNPEYDHTTGLKKAKEEKSFIPYNIQKNIDFAMVGSTYDAGNVYEVSEDFFDKWSKRFVETYNPLFGAFQGAALEYVKMLKIPYVLKVDDKGNTLDPMQAKLDIYPAMH